MCFLVNIIVRIKHKKAIKYQMLGIVNIPKVNISINKTIKCVNPSVTYNPGISNYMYI